MECSSQRVLLLPGFGEDDKIFRKMKPYLNGYSLLYVDYRDVLSKFEVETISLDKFVQEMIEYYDITQNDILIGHSLGGFISHRIKQLVNCPNCLIASCTDPSKIKFPVSFKRIIKLLTMNGMFTSRVFKELLWKTYQRKPSVEEIEHTLTVFESYEKEDIFKLIKIIEPKKKSWTRIFRKNRIRRPSLIIHPIADWIVKSPDEDHIKVPGDHFALATYPEIVGQHLENWLLGMQQEWAHSKEMELEFRLYDQPELWIA